MTRDRETEMGLHRISKEAFYATVGQMSVTPYPIGKWDDEANGYKTEWRNRGGEVIGVEFGGVYEVTDDVYKSVAVNIEDAALGEILDDLLG